MPTDIRPSYREICDMFEREFIQLGRFSIDGDGDDARCLYRAPGDRRCAIGMLIPDDQYSPAFEGESTDVVIGAVPALHGYNPYFLKELQRIHDELARRWINLADAKSALDELRKSYAPLPLLSVTAPTAPQES